MLRGRRPRAEATAGKRFQLTWPPLNTGKVLDIGADWGWTDPYGTFHPDTRYQLQTDDGANIFIRTNGPAQKDGTIHLHCLFETGHKDYYWLNNVVAVGILRSGEGYVVIDTWQVCLALRDKNARVSS